MRNPQRFTAQVRRGVLGEFNIYCTIKLAARQGALTKGVLMTLTAQHRRALIKAISPNRLQTYTAAAAGRQCDVLDLYVWDRDLAAAAMADIAILEVAMRNAMSGALEQRSGRLDWYAVDIGLDNRSLRAVNKEAYSRSRGDELPQ